MKKTKTIIKKDGSGADLGAKEHKEQKGSLNHSKGNAKIIGRLEKIEKYLQDRFNWLNIFTPKDPSPLKDKPKISTRHASPTKQIADLVA